MPGAQYSCSRGSEGSRLPRCSGLNRTAVSAGQFQLHPRCNMDPQVTACDAQPILRPLLTLRAVIAGGHLEGQRIALAAEALGAEGTQVLLGVLLGHTQPREPAEERT